LSEIADADVIDSSHNSCAVEYLPLAAASRSHKGTRIGRILLLLFVFRFDYPQPQDFGVLRLILDIRLSFPFALSFSLSSCCSLLMLFIASVALGLYL
jgi:hypothetical protein